MIKPFWWFCFKTNTIHGESLLYYQTISTDPFSHKISTKSLRAFLLLSRIQFRIKVYTNLQELTSNHSIKNHKKVSQFANILEYIHIKLFMLHIIHYKPRFDKFMHVDEGEIAD